jgi:primosomal protein N' (replication factor Y)
VLLMRAHQAGAGALIAGYTATAEAAHLVQRRWARPLAAPRAAVREHAPRVFALNEERGRDRELHPAAVAGHLPPQALRLAREGLKLGPVLVQVPRSGYRPRLACAQCRETARCGHCNGPLAQAGPQQDPKCGWCGRVAAPWRCRNCRGVRLRSRATGVHRSAEELGRAFSGVRIRESNAARGVLDAVEAEPALVLATPGAEPTAEGGYAAALLLDAPELLNLPTLRAAEQALRRWLGAAALVRPAGRGGAVLLCADGSLPAAQALLRWDPPGFARRELADRTELGYPPSARIAELTGSGAARDTRADRTARGRATARPRPGAAFRGADRADARALRPHRRRQPGQGPQGGPRRAHRQARRRPGLDPHRPGRPRVVPLRAGHRSNHPRTGGRETQRRVPSAEASHHPGPDSGRPPEAGWVRRKRGRRRVDHR